MKKDINDHKCFEYHHALAANREIFLLKFHELYLEFLVIDDYASALCETITHGRTKEHKTLVSLLPMMSLLQRQMRNAFESFSSMQSYQAWVLFRPALESALIMGKWLDDKKYCEIWKNRYEDRKTYSNTFQGSSLESNSLPRSAEIRSVLSKINDDFMHLNPNYYARHSRLEGKDEKYCLLTTSYFDQDEEHEVHLYAFLHLCLVTLRCIAAMLQRQFTEDIAIQVDPEIFEKKYKKKIAQLLKTYPNGKKVLSEFGLWPNQTL